MVNIVILALIIGYCAYLIRRWYKDYRFSKKVGKVMNSLGCIGCSGCGSHKSVCNHNLAEKIQDNG